MFTSIFNSVMNEPSIVPFTAAFKEFIASLGGFYPLVLIALCLVVGLFGRRLSDVIRVVLLFAVGFVASVHWVAPLVQGFIPSIPAYVIGLAIGIFAAVMSRMIYNLVYVGCIGFDTYNICFNALFLVEVTALTKGNLYLCVGIAVAAVVIALLLRKYLEMIITAAAGGIGVAYCVKMIYDYTTFINFDATTSMLIVGAIIAVPMFIYQYYNRVIY